MKLSKICMLTGLLLASASSSAWDDRNRPRVEAYDNDLNVTSYVAGDKVPESKYVIFNLSNDKVTIQTFAEKNFKGEGITYGYDDYFESEKVKSFKVLGDEKEVYKNPHSFYIKNDSYECIDFSYKIIMNNDPSFVTLTPLGEICPNYELKEAFNAKKLGINLENVKEIRLIGNSTTDESKGFLVEVNVGVNADSTLYASHKYGMSTSGHKQSNKHSNSVNIGR